MSLLPATRLAAISSVEETAPLGGLAQGPYLNQMVALETRLAPSALLAALHGIESALGRVRGVRWGPRTIDLERLGVHAFVRQDSHANLEAHSDERDDHGE